MRLDTKDADTKEVKGVFTLILYGGSYSDDLETIAFLDKEGDQYNLEPYASESVYSTTKGVSDLEALAKAEQFISRHSSFSHSCLYKIIDDNGHIIGFELRPLYLPLTYGFSNVLDVDYQLKEHRVIIKVGLTSSVKQQLFS